MRQWCGRFHHRGMVKDFVAYVIEVHEYTKVNPPTYRKYYECSNCGNRWITNRSKHCSQCHAKIIGNELVERNLP